MDRQAVLAHLLETDVCVLPSHTEAFCKARLDAMLCGVAVVTTPVGFGREIVGRDGERGWLARPRDPADLARALRCAMDGSIAWPSLRKRCRAYVQGFTLESWAAEIGRICARQWRLTLENGKLQP
jgi:glycosyltransferase involved in cell wall biosynthesis